MGKNLKNENLVQRTGRLAFAQVLAGQIFSRMEGFTDLGTSHNSQEYSRRYVDEDSERTSVTGYSKSISYAFDRYKGNPVLTKIAEIHDKEIVGATVPIVEVDMTTVTTSGSKKYATAYLRDYSVIPDSDGDSTDALTYSGTFKAVGELEQVTVTSVDDFQSAQLETGGNYQSPTLYALSAMVGGVEKIEHFSSSKFIYDISLGGETSASFAAVPGSSSYSVILQHNNATFALGAEPISISNLSSGDTVRIVVSSPDASSGVTTYTLTCTE